MQNKVVKKVLIIAPFYNRTNFVGVYRIKMFVRWFVKNEFKVILISMGKKEIKQHNWGTEIIIPSKLIFFLDYLLKIGKNNFLIKINFIILKNLFNYLLLPDNESLWARKVSRDKIVLSYAADSNLIISSSPLESVHCASYKISKNLKIPFIVDLRDGWIDEPLKKYLKFHSIKRFLEERLERKILLKSSAVFVTSESWKNLLVKRIPSLKTKVKTLTNAYPNFNHKALLINNLIKDRNKIQLMYTGKFAYSRSVQKIGYLLNTIKKGLTNTQKKININFYTNLLMRERKEISNYKELTKNNCEIKIYEKFIDRAQLLQQMGKANGLLLLSASISAIPLKLFEYIYLQKPVLAVTIKDSEVWKIGTEIPQFFLYDYTTDSENNNNNLHEFFKACETMDYESLVPEKFSEDYLGKIFSQTISSVLFQTELKH